MSDFLYCARERPADQLTAILRLFPGLAEAHDDQRSGTWGTLAAALPQHEREAVFTSDSHTTVVLDSPVVRLPGLAPAPLFVGERRRILHQALGTESFSPDVVDGAFVIATIDHADGTVCIITDRFNFIPVFRASDREGALVLGTHPDAVAQAAGVAEAIDLVSATDLVTNLTCTFPYTLYEGVRQLDPGSVHEFPHDHPQRAPRVYWQPRENNPFRSLREAAVELRQAVRAAVESSCEGVDRVGVLLSGGEDSRAVLAAVPPATQAHAFIYAEWESREVRIARAAAAAYGATLQVGLRAADHYAAGFERTAHLAGSNHLCTDIHGSGMQHRLGLDTMPLVLGGLSADSLLKATYSPRTPPAEFRSRRLHGLREETLREVDVRRNAFRSLLLELRPDSADEWLQLWPFSMRKHGGNLDGNRRLFRTHEVFHATAILDVAAAVPAAWKRQRRLYHRALRPLFARSKFVPHAEYRFPYYNQLGNALLLPALAIARGLRALATGETRARHRPWPRWSRVMNAPEMRAREELVLKDARFAGLFDGSGCEAPARPLDWPALSRLMLVQLGQVSREV